MVKTNTRPVSGTRDFLAHDVLRRRYVVSIVEEVYQSHGFEPLETPVMERLDTLLGKYGEEGDQLIFRVLKRGEKLKRALESDAPADRLADAGLRYDLTVPLARVAAQYQNELPRYFKRYQVQPVYRADRPARGRFREFYQCDVDIVGSTSPVVEAELLTAAASVFKRLGFGDEDFLIRLNHREVLYGLMAAAGVSTRLESAALVALDKLDKVGAEGVEKELAQRGLGKKVCAQLLRLLRSVPAGNDARLEWLQRSLPGTGPVGQLADILRLCNASGSVQHLGLDPFLVRGLSYYTGPIFEVAVRGFNGSAGGGGRYDDLVGMFAGKTLPASGFSLGLERVLLIMDEKGLFPDQLSGQPQILVTQHGTDLAVHALSAARGLRARGMRVDLYPDLDDRYGKQFKYAEQRCIRFAVLQGPDEVSQRQVTVKDLVSGNQTTLGRDDLGDWLFRQLGTDTR